MEAPYQSGGSHMRRARGLAHEEYGRRIETILQPTGSNPGINCRHVFRAGRPLVFGREPVVGDYDVNARPRKVLANVFSIRLVAAYEPPSRQKHHDGARSGAGRLRPIEIQAVTNVGAVRDVARDFDAVAALLLQQWPVEGL